MHAGLGLDDTADSAYGQVEGGVLSAGLSRCEAYEHPDDQRPIGVEEEVEGVMKVCRVDRRSPSRSVSLCVCAIEREDAVNGHEQ